MSEPFEIGVSLALDDGVLEEMTRAQETIKVLQRASKQGSVPVQQLRSIAGESLDLTAPKTDSEKKKVEDRRHDNLEVPALQFAPKPEPVPVSASQDYNLLVRQSDAADRVSVTQAASRTASKPPVAVLLGHTSVPPPPEIGRDFARPSTAEKQGVASKRGKGVKTATDARQMGKAVIAAAATSRIGPAPLPVAPSARVLDAEFQEPLVQAGFPTYDKSQAPRELATADRAAGVLFQVVASGEDKAIMKADPLLLRSSAPALPRKSWGSSLVEKPVGAPVAAREADAAWHSHHGKRGQFPSEMPQERAHAVGNQQIAGDVYFDGTLVGKWISRLLDREAGRAGAGPTSFDTRRGRLLPGPTVK